MKTAILIAALCQFTDPGDTRPGKSGSHPPAELPSAVDSTLPIESAAALPRVWMITSPACPPCARAEEWIRDNGFPFAITRQKPREGQSTPTWIFQGSDGRWWQVTGWRGRETVEQLVQAYAEKNPRQEPVAAPRKAPADDSTVETIRRFAGRGGRFTFVPDQPQNATVADGVTLQVGEIHGRYDLTGAEPRITFDNPTPRGSVEKFGLSIGYRVEGATWSPPKNEVRVSTNWKTIRISLE